MTRLLAHWTITSRGLLTTETLKMQGRDAFLYLDWPYPVEAWYQKRLMELEQSQCRAQPGLIYTGGPNRMTILGSEFLDAIVDGMARVSTRPKFWIQATPDNKWLEIREYVSQYCLRKGCDDLSCLIEVFPFFVDKEEYLRFLAGHPELIAVSGDPVGPNTGAVDCAMSGKLTVIWTNSDSIWPALVPRELNEMLGLGMLNTKTREEFTNLVAMFLLEPSRIDAVHNHISEQAKAKAGPFAESAIAQALIDFMPRLLREAKAAGKNRSLLPDIHADAGSKRTPCPKFTFRESVRSLGENQVMEIGRVMLLWL
jgi:hypothetical protein